MKPLYGEKTHPLTPHAIGILRRLLSHPMPRHEINPGVNNRFEREALTEEYVGAHGWRWVRITDAGRVALGEGGNR